MDLSKILSCKKVLKKSLKLNLCKDDVDFLENSYDAENGQIGSETITQIAENRCVIREKVRIWFCNRKRRDRLECLSQWKRIKERSSCLFATAIRFNNYKSPISKECCSNQVQRFLIQELELAIELLKDVKEFSQKLPDIELFTECD
eukprot:NODE_3_length_80033_cov_0.932970.p57 type:complete len:147 gc:universal NODE_3_length_80033_cov_0.932970:14215-14655(+)